LIATGRAAPLAMLIGVLVAMLIGISKSKKRPPTLRRIAGFEAIEEAVGRATEMGKTVFFTPGYADVSGSTAAPSLAGLEIMSYVARLTARYDTNLAVTVGHPNTYALTQEILRNMYLAEGKLNAFHDDMISFTSEIQFAFTAATLGVVQREKPAACFYIGYFAAEAVVLSEAAVAVNAISIAGATNFFQLPFFAAACDYTMIGEEFLAAGAFIAKDPKRTGGVVGQDYIKFIICVLVLAVSVLATFKVNALADLLKR